MTLPSRPIVEARPIPRADPRTTLRIVACLTLLLLASSVGAQDAVPEGRGFSTATLEGDWRFRLALNAWIPNAIPISVDTVEQNGSRTLDVGFILDHLGYVFPIDGEARKGTFGVYLHTLTFKLVGSVDTGSAVLKWNDAGALIDVGVSYELGRWNLGEGSGAPLVTVEPFAGARLLYDPVDLSETGASKTIDSLTNYVPDLGVRTFWDLTESWNLEIEGDYGGFGVDDNRQTWQALALAGYRWPGWGVHWNIQAGYRAMRLFDLRKSSTEIKLDCRGPNVVLSMEF